MPEAADGLIGAFRARNGEERSSTGGVAGAFATGMGVGILVAAELGRAESGAAAAGVATAIVGVGAAPGADIATGLIAEPLNMASC